jgi:polyisoprenoid-binding protein YceI
VEIETNCFSEEVMQFQSNAARATPQEATVRYVIDAKGSTFLVQASSTGLLSAFGHDPRFKVGDFQGEIEFTPGAPNFDDARVGIRLQADSLEVADDISEKDRGEIERRTHTEVLLSDRYPDIVYEALRITGSGSGERYWVTVNGELTLRGATRNVPVTARVLFNGASLQASGEFTLRQSEFGIPPVTAAGGTIRLKDELKCTFDLVARKRG